LTDNLFKFLLPTYIGRMHRILKTRSPKGKRWKSAQGVSGLLHIINWFFAPKFSMAQYSIFVLLWGAPTLGTFCPLFYFQRFEFTSVFLDCHCRWFEMSHTAECTLSVKIVWNWFHRKIGSLWKGNFHGKENKKKFLRLKVHSLLKVDLQMHEMRKIQIRRIALSDILLLIWRE
jgi:hypothetical protein